MRWWNALLTFLSPCNFKIRRDSSTARDSVRNFLSCIKLCLVHDVAECIVGDYAPGDNVSKERKHAEETNAMTQLGNLLPLPNAEEFQNLFQEFEEQKTPESIFVKDLDRLDMVLQAYEYEQEAKRPGWLQEFYDSTEGKFKTEIVKNFVAALKEKRAGASAKRVDNGGTEICA